MIRDQNLLAHVTYMYIYTLCVGLFLHTSTRTTGEDVARCWTQHRCCRMLEMIGNTHTECPERWRISAPTCSRIECIGFWLQRVA